MSPFYPQLVGTRARSTAEVTGITAKNPSGPLGARGGERQPVHESLASPAVADGFE